MSRRQGSDHPASQIQSEDSLHADITSDPSVDRRSVLQGAGAWAVTAALVGARDGSTGQELAATFTTMPARQAESLASAFGVVAHLHFDDGGVYGRHRAVARKLEELGARHVRTRLALSNPEVRRTLRHLAEHGCRVSATCQVFDLSPQPSNKRLMRQVTQMFGRDARDVFSAFEGVNEPNNDGIPWVEDTRTRTINLWRAAKSHRATRDIPIIGPALADTSTLKEDYRQLGDLTRYTDLGNIHLYPRGIRPSVLIDEHTRYARQTFGRQKFVCTEGGYNNALGQSQGQPVPEDVAGVYAPRHLLEHFIRGNRFYRYELLDDVDPTGRVWESHFGLVRVRSTDPSTWQDKPAFKAMRNFLELVGDRGRGFDAQGLALHLHGGGRSLRHALVQKRDGTHVLCLWRDVTVYDPKAERHIDIAPESVTVTLRHAANVTLFTPARQRRPVRDIGRTRRFTVRLDGDVAVLRLHPGA